MFYKPKGFDRPKTSKYGKFKPIPSTYLHATQNFDRNDIPIPIFEDEPRFVDLYWKSWEFAWDHIALNPSLPQSPYMDEAFNPSKIWIWDTCFMAMFTKYAPKKFPGIQSLDNFYMPMHDKKPINLLIAHYDMPPLFAWVEFEHAKLTGDRERLASLIEEKGYLTRHYEFIDNIKRHWPVEPWSDRRVLAERKEKGFLWDALKTGMDNTLRGRPKLYQLLSWDMKGRGSRYRYMLWVDLLSQQALSALYISKAASILGNQKVFKIFGEKHKELTKLLNQYYWDEATGFYYDIKVLPPHKKIKVTTPTSFWAMLAEACNPHQAKKMIEKLKDPDCLGGFMPYPSMARNERGFQPKGRYWQGGVWLPQVYMCTKALEKYGFMVLADELAYKVVDNMEKIYQKITPHSIWEAYSPTKLEPSNGARKGSGYVNKDFCGWSACGPISMLIENILGFHTIDALNQKIEWRLYQKCSHGIRDLNFGNIHTNLIYDSSNAEVIVESNSPYLLEINENSFKIEKGRNKIRKDEI